MATECSFRGFPFALCHVMKKHSKGITALVTVDTAVSLLKICVLPLISLLPHLMTKLSSSNLPSLPSLLPVWVWRMAGRPLAPPFPNIPGRC